MSPLVPGAVAEAGVLIVGRLMVLPVRVKLPVLLNVATAVAAAPPVISKTCRSKASVPDPTFVVTAESLAPIFVLLTAVWQTKSSLVPIPAVGVPEVWCDRVAAVAGVLVFDVEASKVGVVLVKVLIRSDVSLTEEADWTDSKSSVPTSVVPDGKSVIFRFAMIRTRKT